MTAIREQVCRTPRHTSFFLSAGDPAGVPVIFVHGWPELSISWRHQLPVVAGLGFHAVAPDVRGYGRSSIYPAHADYALAEIVADMIELLDHLGAARAIWVGHDWGAPVVWSIAQQHPDRCHGVAAMCLPYLPEGFSIEAALPYADRALYPEAEHPAAQWDYHLFYRENFAAACAAFDADPRAMIRLAFRMSDPAMKGQPAITAGVRARGGWFGPGMAAPQMPRDEAVLTEADEDRYVEGLVRNGFFGPDSWYMNGAANAAYAARVKDRWRLEMPVLFLHAEYDAVCETLTSRLAEPMRANCPRLTERVIPAGHFLAQERPREVNAALVGWLATALAEVWPA
ncbi:alpha/beta fold hydrolase [Sandaracinobacter sp.]|uniref:alpha/beta fold hydrolase n=1 Tax=Sandaracinobacter sp. TaxID=2487581 RepID=UPI0035ADD050